MNRIAAFTLAAASIVALAGCSAPAERDEARYLESFIDLGDYGPALVEESGDSLISLGDQVCEWYDNGAYPAEAFDLLTDLYKAKNKDAPEPETEADISAHLDEYATQLVIYRQVVDGAQNDLCPEDHQHLPWKG